MAAFRRVLTAACLAPVLACSGDPTGPEHLDPPDQITSCETNTARLCTTWNLVDGRYHATWSQGSTAELEILHFGPDLVAFERRDTGGPVPDMHAFYYGIPHDGTVTSAVVVWNTDGLTFSGEWEASW